MTTEMIGAALQDLRFLELMSGTTGNRQMQARFLQIRSVLAWSMAALEVVTRVSTDAKPGQQISEELVAYVGELLAE